MATPDEHYYEEDTDCWQCGGEGGWNSCMEDTCCAIGGEEGCDDPLCWRRCDICGGVGFIKPPTAVDDERPDKEA